MELDAPPPSPNSSQPESCCLGRWEGELHFHSSLFCLPVLLSAGSECSPPPTAERGGGPQREGGRWAGKFLCDQGYQGGLHAFWAWRVVSASSVLWMLLWVLWRPRRGCPTLVRERASIPTGLQWLLPHPRQSGFNPSLFLLNSLHLLCACLRRIKMITDQLPPSGPTYTL